MPRHFLTMPAGATAHAYRAFTLVELLVVIAVIGILAGLLLPVLSNAKEAARKVYCANNLHQVALATFIYASDNKENIPIFWEWLHDRNRPTDLTTGRLYPYLKSKQVYQCPTDSRELSSKVRSPQQQANVRAYSFAMNCNICHTTALAKFVEPPKTLLYMEAVLQPNDFSGMAGSGNMGGPGGSVSHLLATRHRNRGHLVMADLRVETMNKKSFDKVAQTTRFWVPAP